MPTVCYGMNGSFIALPPTRFPTSLKWTVSQLLHEDRVIEAREMSYKVNQIDNVGIEAEALVREKGTIFHPRPWLMIEAIEQEVGGDFQKVQQVIAENSDALCDEYGWDRSKKLMVTFLPWEAEVPYMPARWGFFSSRNPYDKICLPYHLLANELLLISTFRHEVTHYITRNVCSGREARWVTEGLATINENRNYTPIIAKMKEATVWFDPTRVDALLTSDNRDQALQENIHFAYAQSNALVRTLIAQKGHPLFKDFLAAIGHETLWSDASWKILGTSYTSGALSHVYKISEHEFFRDIGHQLKSGKI